MEKGRDIAQLNLVLELVSEFASVTTLKELERTIDSRLRWILDFEECELRMIHGSDASDDSDVDPRCPVPWRAASLYQKKRLYDRRWRPAYLPQSGCPSPLSSTRSD